MTTANYLEQLQQDKQDLVDNLETQGITGLTGDETFTELVPKVLDIQTGGGSEYTGHYDATGLAQLGWTSEDIQYYQDNAVLWNAEQDNDYKVRDDETTGSLGTNTRFVVKTSSLTSFSGYEKLIGLPVLNINQTNWSSVFSYCYCLLTIPLLNTSNATKTEYMFRSCWNLLSIPLIDTQNVTSMRAMFTTCYNLKKVPLLDTRSNTSMRDMFANCMSLRTIPQFNTSNVTTMNGTFNNCSSLTSVPILNTSKVTDFTSCFANCNSLSDDSLNNILMMCINATSYPYTKSLSAIGLNVNLYSARIQNLSNYQAFIDAGWTNS